MKVTTLNGSRVQKIFSKFIEYVKILRNILLFIFGFILFAMNCILLYVIFKIVYHLPFQTLKRYVTKYGKAYFNIIASAVLFPPFRNSSHIIYDRRVASQKKTFMISNHLYNFDWLLVSILMVRIGRPFDLYIVLKESVAKANIVGTFTKMFNYIPLKRTVDRAVKTKIEKIKDMDDFKLRIQKFKDMDEYNILIYPEGGFISEYMLQKALEFFKRREENDLKLSYLPTRVLIPKVEGVNIMKTQLQEEYEGIIDCTIFLDPYVKSLKDANISIWAMFISGTKAFNMHFYLRYISKDSEKNELLMDSFSRKEKLLCKYSEHISNVGINIQTSDEFLAIIENVDGKLDKKIYDIQSTPLSKYNAYIYSMFGFLILYFIMILIKSIIQKWILKVL